MTTIVELPALSVVVPVLNEEEAVPAFLARTTPILKSICEDRLDGRNYEVLFVDDGSSDATARIVLEAAGLDPCVKLVRLSRSFGKEAALAAGLSYAEGDAVIPMDVDLQDPPEIIPAMVDAWLGGAEIVNGVRVSRDEDTWFKRSTANLFYRLYNTASDIPIERNVGDFRLLDRVVVDSLNRLAESARFTKGLYSWVGYRNANVEYARPARAHGETKWSYRRLLRFAIDGLTASTTAPLRIWSGLGLLIGFSALLYAAFLVVRTMIFGIDLPGYASTLVVILFLGGLNLLSLGVMGEYVGRISQEVRGRPLYVVRDAHGLSSSADQPSRPKPPRLISPGTDSVP
jgi:glycosyltransferase involved in cell wall biosynthesis